MILDTNAISAFAEKDPALLALLDDGQVHYLPVPVLAIDSDTARLYAEIRERLRLLGKPIPVNNLWIAALARQHQQPILSRDTHFDAVAGVDRITW